MRRAGIVCLFVLGLLWSPFLAAAESTVKPPSEFPSSAGHPLRGIAPFFSVQRDIAEAEWIIECNDFMGPADYESGGPGTDTLPWTEDLVGATAAGAGILLVADAANGILELTSGSTDNEGIQTNRDVNGGDVGSGRFKIDTTFDNKLAFFSWIVSFDDVSNGSYTVAVGERDAAGCDGSSFSATYDDGMGWSLDVNTGLLDFKTRVGGAANEESSDDVLTVVDDTYYHLVAVIHTADVSDVTAAGNFVDLYGAALGSPLAFLGKHTNLTFGVVPSAGADLLSPLACVTRSGVGVVLRVDRLCTGITR